MERGSQNKNLLNFFLPEDIVLQILLLLPFVSILECKRVCKQWHTLINDPNFSKDYHHNGSLILLHDRVHLYCILTRYSNKISRHPSYSVHRIPILLTEGINGLPLELLSGWSNGVACVKAANGYFHLYNLFTGASHTVTDSPLQLHSEHWIYYGFGYDRYDDDYKILVVCQAKVIRVKVRNFKFQDKEKSLSRVKYEEEVIYIYKFQDKENNLFWVYSSRNRCWKSFDGFPYAAYSWKSFREGGSYSSNGVLYCVVLKDQIVQHEKPRVARKQVIVTYDLHTRRFGEILARDDDDTHCSWVANVTELDGKLCYTYWTADKWVVQMKCVDGSWTKVLSMDHLGEKVVVQYMALYEMGDGGKVVLFVCYGKLLWYNLSKNKIIKVVDVPFTWNQKPRIRSKKPRISN